MNYLVGQTQYIGNLVVTPCNENCKKVVKGIFYLEILRSLKRNSLQHMEFRATEMNNLKKGISISNDYYKISNQ